jgi:transcriptional regulator GlxA family with amidase domain
VNFVHYVAHIRFVKACDLLKNVDRRISEIAFAVAFQSWRNSTAFSKTLGPIADSISLFPRESTEANKSNIKT